MPHSRVVGRQHSVSHTLACSANKLSALPPGLEALSLLKSLNVAGNPLGEVPAALAQLSLVSLDCASCGLGWLPAQLGQASGLAVLNVQDNQLSELPQGLACARQLQRLAAAGNCMSSLSGAVVGGWRSLEELDLSRNHLQVRLQQ